MAFIVSFRCSNQTINPRQELLGAVISVKNDGDTVLLGHGSCVEGSGNGTGNGGAVSRVVQSLTTVELGTTTRELNDNRSVVGASCFETGVDTGTGDAVDGWDGVSCLVTTIEV